MQNELKAKRQKGRKRLEVWLMIMCVIMSIWKGIDLMIIGITFAFDCLREWTALSDQMIHALATVVVCIPSTLLATFSVYALMWVLSYAKEE